MSGALPLGAPSHDDESTQHRPHLHLVPETLETLLTRVVASLRSSSTGIAIADSTLGSACHLDAIAVIEAGRAAGLLESRKGWPAGPA